MSDEEVTIEQMRQSATGWLARREHSRRELGQKLIRRYGSHPDVERLLNELESLGLLSDRRFAESLTRNRSGRGYGPLRVRAELKAKGVRGEDVEKALDEEQPDWLQLARAALHKRFGVQPAGDRETRARQYRYLAQRGFSSEHIRQVLAEVPGEDGA